MGPYLNCEVVLNLMFQNPWNWEVVVLVVMCYAELVIGWDTTTDTLSLYTTSMILLHVQ